MNLQKLLFASALLISSAICYGQDYFVVEKDTTFCSNLEFGTTGQGYLKSLRYTDKNGKAIVIEGRKVVPNVITFYRQEVTIDKIPQKADKPKSYVRYTERLIDGTLKIYERYPTGMGAHSYRTNAPNPLTMNNSTMSRNQNGSMQTSSGRAGIYKFFLKLPDGTYYKINSKKNMKKYIVPYLKECEAFANQYKGDYSNDRDLFIEMIELYNSVCK
ncbi:hypothetical protein [Psychroserpens luteus]|uniref:Uncharacterized protein n=1 Tax=Psychroserpens luteus TaxID=1434066 RepID=A0ABW5ZTD1_9FLAO|nr:hypothetical protein [Psychroserpens luteus]